MSTETKVKKVTWLARYNQVKAKPGFDIKDFAGRLAFERVQKAVAAIKSIGSPFFSSEADLPIGEKGIEAIETMLADATAKLVEELSAGKRSAVAVSGKIDLV